MKKYLVILAVLLSCCLPGMAQAYGIVNNSGTTGQDSLAVPFYLLDSTGNGPNALADGDSIFIAFFYPSGDFAFADSGAYNDAQITAKAMSTYTTYTWKFAVADVDGASATDGVYSYILIAKDATSAALGNPYRSTFQLYQARDYGIWASAVFDSLMASLDTLQAYLDVAVSSRSTFTPTDLATATGVITSTTLDAGCIGASEIATGAIDADAIAADAIGASEIADNAIDAGAIATDAITAAKIAASAIGTSEIADNAITATEIADGAIDAATFAASAITATVLAADCIGSSEIATDAIGAAELAPGCITASELGTDAIDADAIAADAIGSSELAGTAGAEIRDSNWTRTVRTLTALDSTIFAANVGPYIGAHVWGVDTTGYGAQSGTFGEQNAGPWFDPATDNLVVADTTSLGELIAVMPDNWTAADSVAYQGAASGLTAASIWAYASRGLTDSVLVDGSSLAATVGAISATTLAADCIGASEIAAAAITSSEAPNLDVAVSTRSTLTAADNIGVNWGDMINTSSAQNLSATRFWYANTLDEDLTVMDLDATTIGTVGSVTAVGTNAITAASIAAAAITSSEAPNLDVAVSTRSSFAPGTDSVLVDGSSFAATANAITATTLAADAFGSSELAATWVAEIADGVWDEILATHTITGSVGSVLLDSIDATVGSAGSSAAISDADMSALVDTLMNRADTTSGLGYQPVMSYIVENVGGGTASISDADMGAIIDSLFDRTNADTVSGSLLGYLVANAGTINAADVWSSPTRTLTALDEDATTIDLDGSTVGTVNTVTTVSGGVTVTTNNDKGNYLLAAAAVASLVDDIWDELLSAHSTDGSAGSILYDSVDARVSSAGSVASISIADMQQIAGFVDDTLGAVHGTGSWRGARSEDVPDTNMTEIEYPILKPNGSAWPYAIVTIDLKAVHDSLLSYGDNTLSNYPIADLMDTATVDGLAHFYLIPNDSIQGDSTYYRITARDRTGRNIIKSTFNCRIPAADSVIYLQSLPDSLRW